MRALIISLLFPVVAAAQPVAVNPADVIGFARVDMNEDGFDERFVLVLDSEGGVDLFIFDERAPDAPVYIDNIMETTRYAPVMTALNPTDIEISMHSNDAYGSHDRSMLIEWDQENSAYIVIGLSIETEPRMGDEPHFSCGIDFLVGDMRIVTGDKVEMWEISVPPSPLLNPIPEASLSMCYD